MVNTKSFTFLKSREEKDGVVEVAVLGFPFDSGEILARKKALRRELLRQEGLTEKRVALLSGSTIGDIRDTLELFLLHFGIRPRFHTGEYQRFYEEVLFDDAKLQNFRPDIIYIHTSSRNLADSGLADKLQAVWEKIRTDYACPVIQNNFELLPYGASDENLRVNSLNAWLAERARERRDFYVNDIQRLSAVIGLGEWRSERDYFLYKYALAAKAIPALCYQVAVIIKAVYGRNQKCLALDLDGVLWGGVAGDDGVGGLEVGPGTALGEAHAAFQGFVKTLRDRGILLAVCSKNDEDTAKAAFRHPGMTLRLEDFTVFCANWNDKAENLRKIAEQLNILPESLVFVDDNPAEREQVRQGLPEALVVEADSVLDFERLIEEAGYFYPAGISDEDKNRAAYYAADGRRREALQSFSDYGAYLESLRMRSAIRPFGASELDRIAQLVNKTNQFNLTARRYSRSELERIACDGRYVTLCATLCDTFGENGIVSALIGEIICQTLHIRLWVMSCRVFKRELELAVFDRLARLCRERNLEKIAGYYVKTAKNGYAAHIFDDLGFAKAEDGVYEWSMPMTYHNKNHHIRLEDEEA